MSLHPTKPCSISSSGCSILDCPLDCWMFRGMHWSRFSLQPTLALVGSKPSDGMVTAFAIPPELEKYYDSDSVSCIANLANMTSEEKTEIYRLKESLKGDISSASNIKKFNKDDVIQRLLQFIRAEKPYFQPIINPIDLFVPYYVHPKMSNRRILAQSGAFILYGIDPPKTMFFPTRIERNAIHCSARMRRALFERRSIILASMKAHSSLRSTRPQPGSRIVTPGS